MSVSTAIDISIALDTEISVQSYLALYWQLLIIHDTELLIPISIAIRFLVSTAICVCVSTAICQYRQLYFSGIDSYWYVDSSWYRYISIELYIALYRQPSVYLGINRCIFLVSTAICVWIESSLGIDSHLCLSIDSLPGTNKLQKLLKRVHVLKCCNLNNNSPYKKRHNYITRK